MAQSSGDYGSRLGTLAGLTIDLTAHPITVLVLLQYFKMVTLTQAVSFLSLLAREEVLPKTPGFGACCLLAAHHVLH